jgi:uncharacterized protein YlzI (FlbEa/FlbD family)
MARFKLSSVAFPVLMAAVFVAAAAWAGGGLNKSSCTFNGKKLYGKIEIVTAFPDVKVQEVNAFPDVKVEKVNAFPDKCGKWQTVTAFPDTKVQFVKAFPDVKIQYVTAFPGMN